MSRAQADNDERDLRSVDLPAPLRPYQWDGVSFLAGAEAALLADEMGLGKTVQTSVALRVLYARGELRRALIVVPASLRLNWLREVQHWAPGLPARTASGSAADRQATLRLPIPVVITTYENVRTDIQAVRQYLDFDVVVLDEAQRIKNADSTTALACRLIPRRRSWALTGTPLENRLADLQSVLRFVQPELRTGGLTRPELHDAIRPHFLRRKKDEVLRDLPPLFVQDVPLELEGRQSDAYDELWFSREEFVGQAPSEMHLLALLTKLKQVCNHDLGSGESVKRDALMLILDGLAEPKEKLIVFSQYVETLRWLADQVTGVPSDLYHGGLSEGERDAILQRFRKSAGPRVLFMSLRAGGIGLNLQNASKIVLFDRWWNPAVERQAMGRAHRFGREGPLHVFRFVVVNTIEERILAILEEKEALFDEYVEGAENSDLGVFSRNELLALLQLPEAHTVRTTPNAHDR